MWKSEASLWIAHLVRARIGLFGLGVHSGCSDCHLLALLNESTARAAAGSAEVAT